MTLRAYSCCFKVNSALNFQFILYQRISRWSTLGLLLLNLGFLSGSILGVHFPSLRSPAFVLYFTWAYWASLRFLCACQGSSVSAITFATFADSDFFGRPEFLVLLSPDWETCVALWPGRSPGLASQKLRSFCHIGSSRRICFTSCHSRGVGPPARHALASCPAPSAQRFLWFYGT